MTGQVRQRTYRNPRDITGTLYRQQLAEVERKKALDKQLKEAQLAAFVPEEDDFEVIDYTNVDAYMDHKIAELD